MFEHRWSPEQLEGRIAHLESLPPGPGLAAELEALPETDDPVWQLGRAPRARVIALWDRLGGWVSARALDHFGAEFAQTDEAPDITRTEFLTEVALETRSSHRSVQGRMGLAVALDNLPRARAALSDGELSLAHVRALERHTDHLSADQAMAVDGAVTPNCLSNGWTPSQYAAAVRRAALRVQTDGGRARHEVAMSEADVEVRAGDDGMATLTAYGDALTSAQILSAVNERADLLVARVTGTPLNRLRFAALADLVLREDFQLREYVLGTAADGQTRTAKKAAGDGAAVGGTAGGTAGATAVDADPLSDAARRRRRRRGEALVTIDLLTLLGLADDPAHIDGIGPVPAHLGRLITADATLRRLVTDPVSAEALDLGRTTYTPSDALAAFIRTRDRTCRFPGCNRRLALEIDHIEARCDHGETTRENLHLLCRRHHMLKTAGKIMCTRGPAGQMIWTTRRRRRFRGPRLGAELTPRPLRPDG